VIRFWEKPSRSQALDLYRQRCLWNSFIMAGSIRAFIRMIRQASPEMHVMFESISRWLGSALEQDALTGVYGGLSTSSFAADVLTANTQMLAVLRSSGFEWSDLGEPMRVMKLLGKKGVKSEEEYYTAQRAFV
jgi:mannose-1-phosphate guanylyltransferase